MAWTNPLTWVTNQLVTTLQMNTHIRDNLNFLGIHTHTGAAGDGAADVGPINRLDLNDVSAPAAPGASKLRLYSVAGILRFRAGAAGADTPVGVAISGATPTNVKLGQASAAGANGTASDSAHQHAQPFIGCSLECGGSPGQSIPNNTLTTVAWLNEVYDTDTMHAASATDIIIVTAGKYHIDVNVNWEAFADTNANHWFQAWITAGSIIKSRDIRRNITDAGVNTFGSATHNMHCTVDLAVGDHISVQVFQNSGVARFVEDYPTNIQVHRIG